ncbi:putative wsc domain protein [Botrytis fragariae]|uniref:Putative wsc domain protein n=1 Tax=Botrytis fragariae TaxID=1964551 RepID=A0A8H6EL74_9HELO|nr:putative wsc domain protein [Botrytis fragariae]KAF5876269.1 putative wsc domain protein [Botrytis fragariae]
MLFKPTKTISIAFLGSLFSPASTTFVIQCYSRLVDERVDPVVSPGILPASHVHAIAGGSGFSANMTYADARAAKCGTCNVKEDLSNYWTPKLYYKAQNGSFISVPINGDDGYGNLGGMAIYYLQRPGPDNDPLVPFPENFRMLAGDTSRRSYNDSSFADRAVSFRCTGTDLQTNGFPNINCPDGLRLQVTMPSCWDGVNVTSTDYKSHMSYPADGNFDGGRCPASHPHHMMTLFFEVTYRTDLFANEWYGNSQPFVLANGDTTGYGFHGDFVNGWDIPTLTKGINNCLDGQPDCPSETFTFYEQSNTQECKLAPLINEPVSGTLSALPGCNAPSSGPAEYTPPACPQDVALAKSFQAPPSRFNPATSKAPSLPIGIVDLSTSKSWTYLGCGTDDAANRTLNADWEGNSTMTIETCVNFCASKGHTYAGMEFGSQCYCGNVLSADRAPVTGMLGDCIMPCAGNSAEKCGGNAAITLYQKCDANGCAASSVAKTVSGRSQSKKRSRVMRSLGI